MIRNLVVRQLHLMISGPLSHLKIQNKFSMSERDKWVTIATETALLTSIVFNLC